MRYLIFEASPWWLVIALTIVLSLAIEIPFRFRSFTSAIVGKNIDALGVLQAGLLTLASFVLGLSFSQAQGRFDVRRDLVVKEANAIGTTWLRADQLSGRQQQRFRELLIDYTATRLDAYQFHGSTELGERTYKAQLSRSNRDQDEMWAIISPALRAHSSDLGLSLLMQALNETIDISAEQLQALTTHIPTAVVELTLALITLGALSLGLRFAADGARPAALSAVYVVASVIVVTMMVDYDRPQRGFVTIDLKPIQIQLQSMQSSR
ncbi:MAG: hypothetical protein WB810_06025 [Candidatus Cybelea sp.]